jgi:hypothetical protein
MIPSLNAEPILLPRSRMFRCCRCCRPTHSAPPQMGITRRLATAREIKVRLRKLMALGVRVCAQPSGFSQLAVIPEAYARSRPNVCGWLDAPPVLLPKASLYWLFVCRPVIDRLTQASCPQRPRFRLRHRAGSLCQSSLTCVQRLRLPHLRGGRPGVFSFCYTFYLTFSRALKNSSL